VTANHHHKINGGARHQWTQERIDLCIKLRREDGLSCAQIAARLGGPSRNAVIGKLARLGIAAPTATRRAPRTTRVPQRPRPRHNSLPSLAEWIAVEPLPPRQETDVARVSFLDLEPKHCRFIPGDPIGKLPHQPQFCGLDVVLGLPYCRAHAVRCFDLAAARPRYLPQAARAHELDAV
jgi:GcrA cell cycle regulator